MCIDKCTYISVYVYTMKTITNTENFILYGIYYFSSTTKEYKLTYTILHCLFLQTYNCTYYLPL